MSPRRRKILIGLAVVIVLLGIDLLRAPENQISAAILLTGIDVYQAALSPTLAATGVRCRFEPSCSHYAEAVIRRDGALVGSWRTAGRILRCGPWTEAGTVDPP